MVINKNKYSIIVPVINETYSLEKTIEMEDVRKRYNYNSFWFYKEQSMYYTKIKAFKESFEARLYS